MMMRIGAFALLSIVLASPLAYCSGSWSWEAMPYVWLTAIEGTMTVKGQLRGIDAGIADVWENSNTGVTARLDGWRGGRGFYVDLFYLDLTDKGIDAEAQYIPHVQIFFTDLAITYEIGECPVFVESRELSSSEIRILSYGVLVGARYFYLKNRVDSTDSETLSQSGQFVDPIVGGYFRYRMAEAINLVGALDIGGFHIGSNFTWNTYVRMDFRLADWLWANALYQLFDIDYEEGSGDDKIGLNARIHGPAVGLVFKF